MSYLRTGQRVTKRLKRPQMETTSQARGIPGAITESRQVSSPGAQPTYRACITTISREVRRLL